MFKIWLSLVFTTGIILVLLSIIGISLTNDMSEKKESANYLIIGCGMVLGATMGYVLIRHKTILEKKAKEERKEKSRNAKIGGFSW